MTQPETYSAAEAARILGLSRATVIRHTHSGTLPSIRVGERILIPRSYIDDLFRGAGCPREEAASAS